MIDLISKKDGSKCTDKNLLMNLSTGAIYRRGTNVTDQYDIVFKNNDQQLSFMAQFEHDKLKLFYKTITNNLKKLKGGPLKALIVILVETTMKNRSHAVITNETFMKQGDHLTRRDYVTKSCKTLIQHKLITKKEVDCHNSSFNIPGEKNGKIKE